MQDYFELTVLKPTEYTLECGNEGILDYNGREYGHHCVCVCVENIIGRQLVKMELFSKKVVIYKPVVNSNSHYSQEVPIRSK